MIRKLVSVFVFCLGASALACGAASDSEDFASDGTEAAESSEAALTIAATPPPTATVKRTGPTSIAVPPSAACSCADHPKPGYDCNSCSMWDLDGDGKTVCYCNYGLKSPSNGGDD